MNKDLFALVPNTFEPSLNENYEGIQTFLELEYQGQMTAELKNSMAGIARVTIVPRLLTSIAMATALLLAACTPSSSGDTQQPLPEDKQILGPYKRHEAAIEVRKQGLNQYLIKITTDESLDGQTPRYYNKAGGDYHTSTSSFKKTNDGSAILLERIDLSREPLTTYYLEYIVGYGPGAARVSAELKPDLIITGITGLSTLNLLYDQGDIEIDNLVIEKNAILDTEGRDLKINANKIVSQGRISSREKGGHLELKAIDLIGHLDLEQSGTVSRPGTLDFQVTNAQPMSGDSDCGVWARYNTDSKDHTSFFKIQNNYCWKE